MRVLIKKHVQGVGDKGDIRDVADGYAQNYLIPQGLAEPVSAVALERIRRENKQKSKEAEQDLERVEKLASDLEGYSIEFLAKASEEGRLYAAITAQKIVSKLKKKGFPIDKQHIVLPEPIKDLGDHEVRVQFPHGLEARIVVVIGEDM